MIWIATPCSTHFIAFLFRISFIFSHFDRASSVFSWEKRPHTTPYIRLHPPSFFVSLSWPCTFALLYITIILFRYEITKRSSRMENDARHSVRQYQIERPINSTLYNKSINRLPDTTADLYLNHFTLSSFSLDSAPPNCGVPSAILRYPDCGGRLPFGVILSKV